MGTFYCTWEEFFPLVGRYLSETLSSLTKNAIQVASKILRSLLHMHGPNTPNPQKKNLLENFLITNFSNGQEGNI